MLTVYPHSVTHKHISVNFVSYHSETESLRKLPHGSYVLILWGKKKKKKKKKNRKRITITLYWHTKLSYNNFACISHFLESMLLTSGI